MHCGLALPLRAFADDVGVKAACNRICGLALHAALQPARSFTDDVQVTANSGLTHQLAATLKVPDAP